MSFLKTVGFTLGGAAVLGLVGTIAGSMIGGGEELHDAVNELFGENQALNDSLGTLMTNEAFRTAYDQAVVAATPPDLGLSQLFDPDKVAQGLTTLHQHFPQLTEEMAKSLTEDQIQAYNQFLADGFSEEALKQFANAIVGATQGAAIGGGTGLVAGGAGGYLLTGDSKPAGDKWQNYVQNRPPMESGRGTSSA